MLHSLINRRFWLTDFLVLASVWLQWFSMSLQPQRQVSTHTHTHKPLRLSWHQKPRVTGSRTVTSVWHSLTLSVSSKPQLLKHTHFSASLYTDNHSLVLYKLFILQQGQTFGPWAKLGRLVVQTGPLDEFWKEKKIHKNFLFRKCFVKLYFFKYEVLCDIFLHMCMKTQGKNIVIVIVVYS